MECLSPHLLALLCIVLALTQLAEGLRDSLRCPVRVLKGGRVRTRSRGRVAKYVCNNGFQVLGEKYSTCIRGKWDSPVPTCIKSGCMAVDVPHGQVLETYRGALVTVHCDPGYSLFGSQSLYCNGAVWNDTAPTCREIQVRAQKWCDFESEDLCGWTHDVNHDFDWRRHNFATPSGHVGTGPSYDHTLGPGLNGHYMYLEVSSPRLENDTARLFSPVFNAITDPGACFKFWYHMYGITTGTLNVYLHNQDTVLLFHKSGDQGDQWLQATIPLPQITSSFQIVMEGVRGAGNEGDIAIDDVKLTEGQECAAAASSATSDLSAASTEEAPASCEGRCSVRASDPSVCECSLDCVANSTCCPDYADKCPTGVSAATYISGSGTSSVQPLTTIKPNTTAEPYTTTLQKSLPSNTTKAEFSTDNFNTSTRTLFVVGTVAAIPTASNPPPSNPSVTVLVTDLKQTDVSSSAMSTPPTVKVPFVIRLPPTTVTPPISQSRAEETTLKVTKPITTTFNMTRFVTMVPKPTMPSLKTNNQTVLLTKIMFYTTKSSLKPTIQLNTLNSATKEIPKVMPKIPKIEFVTPPPIVVFRNPSKTIAPYSKSIGNFTVNVKNSFTTLSPYKILNKTEKVKSKNDVLHPVGKKSFLSTPALPPLGPHPGSLTTKPTKSTRYRKTQPPTSVSIHQMNSSRTAVDTKWKSQYKLKDEAPVHAQYSVDSSADGATQMLYGVLLVAGVLLVLVTTLASACVLRRHKINRRRMEDDELDIQFLASDEILDFTLARPSAEDIQMSETRR